MRKSSHWREGILIGVLLLSALWLGSRIWNLGSKAELAWSQAHDTKAEYQSLEERKSSLQANLASLQTPRGEDQAIRQAFGVARPGEEVIVVLPPATTTATTTPPWWDVWSWF